MGAIVIANLFLSLLAPFILWRCTHKLLAIRSYRLVLRHSPRAGVNAMAVR